MTALNLGVAPSSGGIAYVMGSLSGNTSSTAANYNTGNFTSSGSGTSVKVTNIPCSNPSYPYCDVNAFQIGDAPREIPSWLRNPGTPNLNMGSAVLSRWDRNGCNLSLRLTVRMCSTKLLLAASAPALTAPLLEQSVRRRVIPGAATCSSRGELTSSQRSIDSSAAGESFSRELFADRAAVLLRFAPERRASYRIEQGCIGTLLPMPVRL